MIKAPKIVLLLAVVALSNCRKNEDGPVAEVAKPAEATLKGPTEQKSDRRFSLYKSDEDEFEVEVPSYLGGIKVKQNPGPGGKWRTNDYRVDASRFIGGILIKCQKFAKPGIPAQNVRPMLKEGLDIWLKGKTSVFEKEVRWADTDAIRARMKQQHKGRTVYSDYLLAYVPSNRTAYTAIFISSDLQILDGEEGKRFFASFKHTGK